MNDIMIPILIAASIKRKRKNKRESYEKNDNESVIIDSKGREYIKNERTGQLTRKNPKIKK